MTAGYFKVIMHCSLKEDAHNVLFGLRNTHISSDCFMRFLQQNIEPSVNNGIRLDYELLCGDFLEISGKVILILLQEYFYFDFNFSSRKIISFQFHFKF